MAAAFSWCNWEQDLFESYGSPEGAHEKGLLSSATIYTASISLAGDWPVAG